MRPKIQKDSPDTSKPPTQAGQLPVDVGHARLPDDRIADRLRGFGPLGLLAIFVIAAGTLVTPLLGAVLVLGWVWRSRTPWREIGYARPKSWMVSLAIGIALGCALKLLSKSVVMPLLGASPINPAYQYLAGNAAALPGILLGVVVGGGFAEETVYRGYLFERLRKLLGAGVSAKILIVLLGAGMFALVHYPEQGVAGVQQAVITGLTFGTVLAVTGRIWIPMVAHAAFDVASIAIIYLNLESALAHLVFK